MEALLGHICSHEAHKASEIVTQSHDVLARIQNIHLSPPNEHDHDTTTSKSASTKSKSPVPSPPKPTLITTTTPSKKEKKKDAFVEMQKGLGELLKLKNRLDGLELKCSEVANALSIVLKNDEDMAAMRLSEQQYKEEEENIVQYKGDENGDDDVNASPIITTTTENVQYLHVDVELLFEDYLLQMDEVLYSLRSVQDLVRNTEEVVEIELDLLRNRIMRYEMLLELSGLVSTSFFLIGNNSFWLVVVIFIPVRIITPHHACIYIPFTLFFLLLLSFPIEQHYECIYLYIYIPIHFQQ